MPRKKKKNIILLIDSPTAEVLRVIGDVKKRHGKAYKFILLYSNKSIGKENKDVLKKFVAAYPCNYNSPDSIIEALLPHKDSLVSAYCRPESQILNFQKVIPHVPYLRTPTSESLEWSVNKHKMRKRFSTYDNSITPKFMLVKDNKKSTLKEIEKKIGFPLVVKPVGLAQSLLVNIVFHPEELSKNVNQIFRKINSIYKDQSGYRGEPQVIVEQFIEGGMYSIDGYVNSRGKIYFCPMVSTKTGREIGFDDFFGYQQITPTTLGKKSVEEAEKIASSGVQALGLRSTSFHAELVKIDSGWKIIEIGARIGGFRKDLYRLSYNMNHIANAVDIAIPKVPKINKKVLGHSVAMKFFAKKEGIITNLIGIKKAKELKSVVDLSLNKKVGSRATYAKNGGKSVFTVMMFNKERSKLLADIRRLEQMIKIETKKGGL